MAKEMIISVNGREKKIAILENGHVTEFYIERGEENSGIVGNIYKGRVQRVLPGMQSAFVEIGLERDAFLYVSDFFDEEEEFERIMVEKTKKTPLEVAEREVAEELRRARLAREQQMEAVQEIAEPLVTGATGEASATLPAQPEASETETARTSETAQTSDEEQPRSGGRNRRGRGRKNREDAPERTAAPETGAFEEPQSAESDEDKFAAPQIGQSAEPLFAVDDSGFERVIDDEETTGEMFKDAYLQEAIVDKIRAIEFDMETISTAEVGSLLNSVGNDAGGFERIADDEPVAPIVTETEDEPAKGRRKPAARGGKKSKKEPAPIEEVKADDAEPTAENQDAGAEDAAGDDKSKKKKRGGSRRKKSSDTSGEETLENAEASVNDVGDIAEMAVRRGGRRRRGGSGGGNRPPGAEARDVQTEERPENGEPISENEGEAAEAVPVKETSPAPRQPQGGNGRRDGRDNRDNRESRDNRDNRDSRDNRETRDSRDNRGGRPPQPTISDLLREGQEILVQIAKEPIARKGARITSHIALPGRYLVYMPTIEHVGVSRKIESAAERGRLRTSIQRIRAEEDVPSGGFIVRTAGVGVPEENLREDARYLVRTWKDVKKQAEKSKSPAVVHQDLDLIQRILRDQLSEDFAAIRVDSEDEFLRTVEFINRIQPKMTNRVKLYTRDEPILEYYGVQEEVDKALKPRVWLRSGGYLVINQTEALVAIDVNTGKFVGKGNARLEDTITRTNMEAVDEIARQIRLRDLGGIIVLDLIDMEDRRNRHKVMQALQEALQNDKSPTKVLSFNDFGLVIMTRKRVKQSLERTLCAPCAYCQGAGLVKSAQTICYEILDEARRLSKGLTDVRQTTLRVNPEVAKALRGAERVVLDEVEAYLGVVDITSDPAAHQEQFDFAFI